MPSSFFLTVATGKAARPDLTFFILFNLFIFKVFQVKTVGLTLIPITKMSNLIYLSFGVFGRDVMFNRVDVDDVYSQTRSMNILGTSRMNTFT